MAFLVITFLFGQGRQSITCHYQIHEHKKAILQPLKWSFWYYPIMSYSSNKKRVSFYLLHKNHVGDTVCTCQFFLTLTNTEIGIGGEQETLPSRLTSLLANFNKLERPNPLFLLSECFLSRKKGLGIFLQILTILHDVK